MFINHEDGLGWYSVNTVFKIDEVTEHNVFVIEISFINSAEDGTTINDSFQILTEKMDNLKDYLIQAVSEFYNGLVSDLMKSSQKLDLSNYKFEGIDDELLGLIAEEVAKIKVDMATKTIYFNTPPEEKIMNANKTATAQAAENLMSTPAPVQQPQQPSQSEDNIVIIETDNSYKAPYGLYEHLSASLAKKEDMLRVYKQIAANKKLDAELEELHEQVKKMKASMSGNDAKIEEEVKPAAAKAEEAAKEAVKDINWQKVGLYTATAAVVVGTAYMVYKRFQN